MTPPPDLSAKGKYMYCIIQAEEIQDFGPLGVGGGGDSLVTVHDEDLACVISESPLEDYAVTREYTMAHHQAIMAVRKRFPAVLPVCFNTIAKEGEQAIVEKVLKRRREEFLKLLEWAKDKEEVGVKAYWRSTDPVFKRILEENQKIKALRDELAKRSQAARYYDQIELGKQVEVAFKATREQEGKRIVESLKSYAVDVKQDPVYGEKWLLNSAFFVEKEKIPQFGEALERLAQASDGNLNFKYTPEGAPFHFVEVRISWEEGACVSH